jgi:hypothetical protein
MPPVGHLQDIIFGRSQILRNEGFIPVARVVVVMTVPLEVTVTGRSTVVGAKTVDSCVIVKFTV